MDSPNNKEKNRLIPYKYEDAENKVYKEKIIDNDISKNNNGDILVKIEDENESDNNINENDSKVYNKYEKLSEEELINLLKEKNDNLIKMNEEKEKTKKILNNIIKKINTTTSNNLELLYKTEANPEIINELESLIEFKKKMLKYSKDMNQNFKNKYLSMKNKKDGNLKIKGKFNDKESQLNILKNENKNLELEIRKYKDDGIFKKKELEIICEDKVYPLKIKMKSGEFQDSINKKHGCFKKINMSLNSIKNLIKEVEHLENMYSKADSKIIEDYEKIGNKINFWTDIIKSDLTGTENEIISKIEKDETRFIKEIKKKEINKNDKINKLRFSSPINKEKVFVNHSIVKLKPIKHLEIDEINNTYKEKEVNNKEDNPNFLYSQINTENNVLTTSNNRYKNLKNIISPKGIFSKFSFLKQKPSTSENRNNNRININEEKSSEDIIEKIIQKDYEDTTDEDYRELLDKKAQYLETNSRLEENIKNLQRTVNKKYSSVEELVQGNSNQLDILKSKNEILEKEIDNLNKVYKLTLEQQKIKCELKQKNKIGKENKKQKEINLLESENISSPIKIRNIKNNSGYMEVDSEKKIDNETREEKLLKIKNKYKDMNMENMDELELEE